MSYSSRGIRCCPGTLRPPAADTTAIRFPGCSRKKNKWILSCNHPLDFMGNVWVNRSMEIICEYCGNTFYRDIGRYNEAIKNNWRQFCSPNCQNNAKQKRIELRCSYPECKKLFVRKLSQILLSDKLFCSSSCSAKYYGRITKSDHAHPCNLPGCNNVVTSDYPGKKYCSPECLKKYQKLSTYSKESVVQSIQNFHNQYERIPLKYELGAIYAPARRFFGTWNNAIKAAGYDPNPVMFAKHYLANDGHKCDSMAEKIVDDWLYGKKIKHRVHVPYPWNNGMKCDFLIGDTWVEIFGLEGNVARYDELKREKLELAKIHKLKLFRLTLKDVYSKNRLAIKLGIFYTRRDATSSQLTSDQKASTYLPRSLA